MNLVNLLKYAHFTAEVKLFIKEAICHSHAMRISIDPKNENRSVYKTLLDNCHNDYLPNVFDWFYKCGGAVIYDFDFSGKRSFLEFSNYIIDNSAYIYKTIHECKYQPKIYNKKTYYSYRYWISAELRKNYIGNSIFEMFKEYLDSADLSETYLQRANLSKAILSKAYLELANLLEANLSNADLCNADLCDANLHKANLNNAKLRGSKLHRAKLNETYLYAADLYKAELPNANLRKADLRKAKLIETNLREADLYGADLCEANLQGSNLWGTDLRETDLREANLQSVKNISCAVFWSTVYNDNTIFPDGFNVSEPEFIKIQ